MDSQTSNEMDERQKMFDLRPGTTKQNYRWGLGVFKKWCDDEGISPMDVDKHKFAEFIKEKRLSYFPKNTENLLKNSVASIYGKELVKIPWIGKNS